MRTIITLIAGVMLAVLTPNHGHAVNDEPLRIVAAGDSITQGSGTTRPHAQSWPARLRGECGSDCRVINTGRGGSCLVAVGCGDPLRWVDTFKDEVLSHDPDLVIVALGRNDLCHATTRQMIDAYRDVRRAARAADAITRFATITPAGSKWQWPCEEQRIEVNTWLRAQRGTLEFERAVMTRTGLLRGAVDYDGLHLNKHGYDRLARIAYKEIF